MAATSKLGPPPEDGPDVAGGEAAAPVEQNIVPACCTSVRRRQPFGADRFGVGSEGCVLR